MEAGAVLEQSPAHPEAKVCMPRIAPTQQTAGAVAATEAVVAELKAAAQLMEMVFPAAVAAAAVATMAFLIQAAMAATAMRHLSISRQVKEV